MLWFSYYEAKVLGILSARRDSTQLYIFSYCLHIYIIRGEWLVLSEQANVWYLFVSVVIEYFSYYKVRHTLSYIYIV